MKTNPNDPIGKSSQVSFNEKGRLNETYFDGMTIRQHYAGLALQGVLCADSTYTYEFAAKEAVLYADALIAELNRTASDNV